MNFVKDHYIKHGSGPSDPLEQRLLLTYSQMQVVQQDKKIVNMARSYG
jgi:hypothetical protein